MICQQAEVGAVLYPNKWACKAVLLNTVVLKVTKNATQRGLKKYAAIISDYYSVTDTKVIQIRGRDATASLFHPPFGTDADRTAQTLHRYYCQLAGAYQISPY